MTKFAEVDFYSPENTFRVSYSGGKDSSAMLLMLLEKGYPVNSIDFMDSDYEYPEVYEYIDKIDVFVNKNYGKTVNHLHLKPEWEFQKWFYGKFETGQFAGVMRGFPRVRGRCYLSRQKGRTLDRYDRTSFRYIGIGWNEKHRETDNPRLLYPLIEWEVTEDQCVEYLKEKDLLPTHKKYYTRSGCWWCPKQSMTSARSIFVRHPDLWEQIKVWEKESPVGWNMPGKTTPEWEARFKNEIVSGKIDIRPLLDDKTEEEISATLNRIKNA